MNFWIDLNNPPHSLFFSPIVKELRERGHKVILTARNYPGLVDLAILLGLHPEVIGENASGTAKWRKAVSILQRTLRLALYIRRNGPVDLALCHGSRSLILASKLLGIPNLVFFDYEQAERFIKTRFGDNLMVPEPIYGRLQEMGFPMKRIKTYPGQKENVYLHELQPSHTLRKEIGVLEEEIFVVLRPPSFSAHYHDDHSLKLLDAVLKRLLEQDNLKVLSVSRTEEDRDYIRRKSGNNEKIIFPDSPLNGLALIHQADLVISGGGTMSREAAAMGVPAYSIFTGAKPHIDEWLEEHGKVLMLRSPEETDRIAIRKRVIEYSSPEKHPAFQVVIDHIEKVAAYYTHY